MAMKCTHREILVRHNPDRAPLCGLITYLDPDRPTLIRRMGWEISDDIHDDYVDQVSMDNGRTWSEPRAALSSRKVDAGHIVYTENAALLVPDRRLLITWTNEKLEGDIEAGCDLEGKSQIAIGVRNIDDVCVGKEAPPMSVSDFGLEQGLCVSFCTPIIDSTGRILAPVQWQQRDVDGSLRNLGLPATTTMPDVMRDTWQVGLLVGTFDAAGELAWQLQSPVPIAPGLSSRGLCEGTVIELTGGRLVMILRGSNHAWLDRPGYKWLSFSDDGGATWSSAAPLMCDDGSFIQSSASGSALFRSSTDNRLYWIGNLCTEGATARGNDPRSPLVIARMREDPFAIERDTITTIDAAREGDDPRVQHSNFKFYQDRETSEVVVQLTRYGERGYADNAWLRADHYLYRVDLNV